MSLDLSRIKFGIGSLDLATMGGYLEGRSLLLYAKPKAGKTTVAYHALASFQNHDKESKVAVFASERKA